MSSIRNMAFILVASGLLTSPVRAQEGEGAVTVPESEAWRAERPAVPEPEPPVLPAFEAGRLDNGLRVIVTRVEGVPLVSLELVTMGGSALDPEGQEGVTALMYTLLGEGTQSLDALAFSDRVADLGARFGAGADRDHGSLSIGGLARHADELVRLLADVARRPRMAPEDFARARAETLASLERSLGSPQGLAFMLFPGLVYGPSHPFGHTPSGTPSSVAGLTVEQVRAQHAAVLQPQRSALIATGDIDLEQAMALARAGFGDWEGSGGEVPPVPGVEAQARAAIQVVDRPGTAQTMMLFGRPMFARGHPDEIPVQLGNEAWGGSFSSRLNMNLREEKGYTYGARSQVAFRRGVGVFLAYAAVQTEHTAASVAEVFQELSNLDDEPLTEAEIELARDGIVRSLTGQFQSTSAVANAASSLFVYDLDLDYYQALGPRFTEAKADAVRAALSTYLEADVMQILLVGDLAEIRPQLEASKLGPLEVIDPEAALGSPPADAPPAAR